MTPAAGQVCSVQGCDRTVFGRGWCSAHYFRWRNHGDVQAHKPVGYRSVPKPCDVPGCERTARTRGWCSAHYQRWLRHGDVRAHVPIQKYSSGTIVLSACVWVSNHASRTTRSRARKLADRGGRYLVPASTGFLERMVEIDGAVEVTDENIERLMERIKPPG